MSKTTRKTKTSSVQGNLMTFSIITVILKVPDNPLVSMENSSV